MKPPHILISAGEPAGIGPDLCVQIAQDPPPVELTVVADPQLLLDRARQLQLPLDILTPDASATAPGQLRVLAETLRAPVQAGRADPANAAYVLGALGRAVDACRAGDYHALVTGPVHKGLINAAGIAFTGHTEWLAQHCGAPLPVMMLTAPGLRVALVTTHLPLRAVSDAITPQRLEQTLHVLHHDLRTRFAIAEPRILVLGLNPHAGEDGHLGREEIDVIEPVLARLRAQGMALRGPLPADTAFIPKYLTTTDVVLAMYHDQGLPVLKHAGFGAAVNITLGLPIIRSSVDHGTALELAGTGTADAASLRTAIDAAAAMVRHSRHGA